jgi:pterin-4a-carbinolamine dehydratase
MRRGVIFVSYRRDDAGPFALALAAELELRLAGVPVFVDLNRIVGGHDWSDTLDDALEKSRLVIALIGKKWRGRRNLARCRMFDDGDWVRKEVRHGIEHNKVMPLLLEGASIPSDVPADLKPLRRTQSMHLRAVSWSSDIDAVCSALSLKGFPLAKSAEILPKPDPLLSERDGLPAELLDPWLAAATNRGWKVFSEYDRLNTLAIREYLRKTFNFQSDKDALAFMGAFGDIIERFTHHPIIHAKYKSVTISLSTWDARHQITDIDTGMAEAVDQLSANWPQDASS